MELLLLFFVFVSGTNSSRSCNPTIQLSSNPATEKKTTDITCQWDSTNCDQYSYSVIEKNVDGTYEVAMKFEGTDFEGYILTNGVSYEESDRIGGLSVPIKGQISLAISNAIFEDSGEWRCSVVADQTHTSNSETLIIYSHENSVVINIEGPDFILLGTQHSFVCSASTVYPQLDVAWNVNGVNRTDGRIDDIDNEYYWNIQNTLYMYVNGDYDITCYMTKSTVYDPWSKSKKAPDVDIYVPTRLEDEYISNAALTPEYNFTMSCIVSGSTPTISWHHDESEVSASMFSKTNEILTGNFTFGEPHALRSTLTWILPDESKWCDELDAFSGVYHCTGNSAKGPAVTSSKTSVIIQYAPILVNPGDEEIAAMMNETVTITCFVKCASPSDVTYIWTSENDRDGIGENATIIEITVTEDDFQNTFTCTVENSIGAVSKRLSIRKKETTIAMTTTTELLPTSSGPAESSANKSGLDFGARLGIGFTVGIVFCGIIVSSFIIYHRTKCYKKQKTSLHQNAYENEDITLDDHADVTPYEQVNDIDYEPDHPKNYVNVKPTSYVNAKSTSFANIDPTSYVNVNAMEPSKYEQLKQRNSGNIEISTYEDLNGKAK